MLANDLAESITKCTTATITAGRLWRQFLLLLRRLRWLSKGPDLLNRADADAVRFAQGAIHRARFSHAHLGPVDQERNVRWIGVTITNELVVFRPGYRCLEDPAALLWVGHIFRQLCRYAFATSPFCDPQQGTVS